MILILCNCSTHTDFRLNQDKTIQLIYSNYSLFQQLKNERRFLGCSANWWILHPLIFLWNVKEQCNKSFTLKADVCIKMIKQHDGMNQTPLTEKLHLFSFEISFKKEKIHRMLKGNVSTFLISAVHPLRLTRTILIQVSFYGMSLNILFIKKVIICYK